MRGTDGGYGASRAANCQFTSLSLLIKYINTNPARYAPLLGPYSSMVLQYAVPSEYFSAVRPLRTPRGPSETGSEAVWLNRLLSEDGSGHAMPYNDKWDVS
eukprot:2833401-Rhodomonas_salina.1